MVCRTFLAKPAHAVEHFCKLQPHVIYKKMLFIATIIRTWRLQFLA